MPIPHRHPVAALGRRPAPGTPGTPRLSADHRPNTRWSRPPGVSARQGDRDLAVPDQRSPTARRPALRQRARAARPRATSASLAAQAHAGRAAAIAEQPCRAPPRARRAHHRHRHRPVTGQPATSGNVAVTPVTTTENGTASVPYRSPAPAGPGTAGGERRHAAPAVTGSRRSRRCRSRRQPAAHPQPQPAPSAAAAPGSVSAGTAGPRPGCCCRSCSSSALLLIARPAALLLAAPAPPARASCGPWAELRAPVRAGERISTADAGAARAADLFGPPPGGSDRPYGCRHRATTAGPADQDRPIRIIPRPRRAATASSGPCSGPPGCRSSRSWD